MFFAMRNPKMFDRVLSLGIVWVTKQVDGFMATRAVQNVYGASARQLRFVENRLRRKPASA